MIMKVEVKELAGQLTELVRQVQAGNEVLLTQDNKLVARLVPVGEPERSDGTTLHFHSLEGHRVLTPSISQPELAEEMFKPQ
jgi:prevent-host-death family protein